MGWRYRAERSRCGCYGYLLLGLGLLHHLAAHLDAGGEDGSGEVSYVDALQVADFLSSYGDTGEGFIDCISAGRRRSRKAS